MRSLFRLELLLVAAVLLFGPALATPPGLVVPERTDLGDWPGTWTYTSRDSKIALWIRQEGRVPQLRIQYLSIDDAEAFVTDWDGKASYTFRGKTGSFAFDVTEADENVIRGTWAWSYGSGDGARVETANVTLYRGSDGRLGVLKFDDYKLARLEGTKRFRTSTEQVWTFLKVSRRQALWDELPF